MNYKHFIRRHAQILFSRFTGKRADLLNRRPEYIRQDYDDLVEEIVLSSPNKCPVWQCGGIMKFIERSPPRGVSPDEIEYNGDWQTPDQVCTNCGAVYSFQNFKGRSRAKNAKHNI